MALPVVPSVGGKGGGKNKLVSDMGMSGGKPSKGKIVGSMKKSMTPKGGARKRA